ncbi:Bax inhibitor-1/YccA family protein [Bacillus sp. DX1.1]|uniref:Bax inhibitor-1/YccA family protein n=1 Tax=unclassified Bacillus (in: firmicutes) TaxID=185979 RepID=UPI0025707F30|nr:MULTISPECIES: Bax inhibitor-1/YccA family protein [unclassified Bacillus (in: firmicutes)]MDM5154673.1 Bax inhibitor-1/YccA family protein [Bacillus sp. DX1.1]WJE83564.1 Bax inhibitor-1/YccA family protein [Bacillus sp. DX3.1]
MRTSNPMLKKEAFRKEGTSTSAMTIGGTVGKTFIMLVLLLATSVYSYIQMYNEKMQMPVLIGALIIATIIAFASMFFPRISPIGAPIYAAVEGIVLGSISAMYTIRFGDSIILHAVLLTISILFAMLVLFATRAVKVTDKFRTGVMAATFGIMIMYLIVFLLQMFGVSVPYLHQGGTIGIIISAVVIVVAALNLLLDFDFIENGARGGAPKYMEWYGAMGLMMTLVWLYLEILRFVSYFTKND